MSHDGSRPLLDELMEARRLYRTIEPRDLFYRAANDLVDRAWRGRDSPLNIGEAIAVLLYTWNRPFYQYRPPGPDHVNRIEAVRSLVERSLSEGGEPPNWVRMTAPPTGTVAAIFAQFEEFLWPVGTAKALHLLAPRFFPIWDASIAAAYGCGLGRRGTNASRYVRFRQLAANQCARLSAQPGAPRDLVKALDEWNYVHITKGMNLTEAAPLGTVSPRKDGALEL